MNAKQLQQKADRLNKLETLRYTDIAEFIRELYANCREEYYPKTSKDGGGGFTALRDPITDEWYSLAGGRLPHPHSSIRKMFL